MTVGVYDFIKNDGAYRVNDEGKDELMFESPGNTPTDYLKAMLFGRYINENGQNTAKGDYKEIIWKEYIGAVAAEENLFFEQKESLRYFLSANKSDLEIFQ